MHKYCKNAKDVVALIMVVSYSLSFLLTALIPNIEFNEIMGRHFKEMLMMVIGFYFGSHKEKGD